MPSARDIAIELRKLADALDKQPETELTQARVYFMHGFSGNKTKFLNLGKLLPRPLSKEYETGKFPDFILTHSTDALVIEASIQRSEVCEILEPAREAVYHCPSIFSDEEEESIAS